MTALVLAMATIIVASTMVAGHRFGLFVHRKVLRLPPDLGAVVGLVIGLALALHFLASHGVLPGS